MAKESLRLEEDEDLLPATGEKSTFGVRRKEYTIETQNSQKLHFFVLYVIISCLLASLGGMLVYKKTHDPTLSIYCKAKPVFLWSPNDWLIRF